MKNIFLFLSLLILRFSYTNAQSIYYLDKKKDNTEKLLKAIQEETVDSIKALKSYEIAARFVVRQDLDNYNKYIAQGDLFSKNSQIISDIGLYYKALIGFTKPNAIELLENDFNTILPILKKYNETDAKKLRLIMFQNLSNFSLIKGKEAESMDYLLNHAIPIAKSMVNNPELLGTLYKDVAIRFYNEKNYAKTLEYINLSEINFDKIKEYTSQSISSQCELYMLKAEVLLMLNKQSEALKYLDKTNEILKKYPENNFMSYYYSIMGLYYKKNKKYQEALKTYDLSIENAEKHKNDAILTRTRLFKQELYSEIGEFAKANTELKIAEKGAKIKRDRQDILKEYSENYIGLKDSANALLYAEKYVGSFDSINTVKKNRDITLLEAKYNQVESKKKIAELNLEKKQIELKSKSNQMLTLVFSFLALLSFTILFFVWRTRKNEKKLSHQVEINYIQKIENLKNLKKLELSQAILEGEEQERKRLARELHDGLGSWLSGIRINFLNLRNKNLIENQDFNKLDEQLNSTIKELRSISHNLLPETLVKLGLENSLQDICSHLTSEKLKIDLQTYGIQNDLSENFQIAVFRIIQELLNNVVKHSEATEVLVSCTQDADIFLVTVEDNGKGFSMNAKEKGIGLKNIENRVHFLNGKLDIETDENGTSIYIEFQDFKTLKLSQIG